MAEDDDGPAPPPASTPPRASSRKVAEDDDELPEPTDAQREAIRRAMMKRLEEAQERIAKQAAGKKP